LASGAVLLALSRPFEGVLVCGVAAGVLAGWLFRRPHARWQAAVRLAVPVAIVGGAGLAFLVSTNRAVTGNASTLPYSVHSRQYSATSMWIWKPLPELPKYNLPRMESMYVNWSRARQLEARTLHGYLNLAAKKLGLLWSFFPLLGGLCVLPALVRCFQASGWHRLALVTVAALVVISLQLVHSYAWPHYLAPAACLFYVVLGQGLRGWHVASRRYPAARIVLPGIVIFSIAHLATAAVWHSASAEPQPRQQVESLLAQLPGRHLVFVEYPARHNLHQEWVCNRADLDAAQIVWANCLSPGENRQLVEWYGTKRSAWIWRTDQPLPAGLRPFERNAPASPDSSAP
jgi:hypothetical protein